MRILRFLPLLLAVPAAALAAVDTTPATCPVDEADVQVSVLLSTNALLGHDRDLCPHAAGDDEIRSAVSACHSCGFAGTTKEFGQKLPDEVSARVKKELVPAQSAWERYANRARILEWSEAPAPVIGESWLRAAWSVRLEERPVGPPLSDSIGALVKSLPSGDGDAGADPLLGPAQALDAKAGTAGVSAEERAAALYASGTFWRARGEIAAAEERYAKALAAAKGGSMAGALEAAVARDRASMELEAGYLKKALAHFRAALAAGEKVPKSQRGMLAFLAAECARRTGGNEEAQRLYKIAQALADGPEVKSLIEQGLADTAPAKPARKPAKKAANP